MAAVFADESTVRSHLGRHDDVAIAAINGPANVVISGAAHSIEAVLSSLGAAGVTSRPLNVSNAFHSPLMDPMLEAFTAVAATVELGQPTIPFVSTVSGSVEDGHAISPQYWVDHVSATVRFEAAINAVAELGVDCFVEVGPKPTLSGMIAAFDSDILIRPSLRPGSDDRVEFTTTLGTLWSIGLEPSWDPGDGGLRPDVDIPTYPFQRKRYWIAESANRARGPRRDPPLDQLSTTTAPGAGWLYEPTWQEASPTSATRPTGEWLIVTDDEGWGDTISARLHDAGHGGHVVVADRSSTSEPLGQRLAATSPPVGGWSGVVYAAAPADVADGGLVAHATTVGDLLTVTQALAGQGQALGVGGRLWVVTRNARAAGEPDVPVDLAVAPLWGFSEVIALELPSLRVSCVDLDPNEPNSTALLVDELLGDDDEDRIAFRNSKRLVARLRATQDVAAEQGRDRDGFSADRTYLITGGLGGLGLEAAKSIVARGVRHVVLVSRRSPSPAAVESIKALQEVGASVTTRSVDVGDRTELSKMLTELRTTSPPLGGVIHAAGVIDDQLVDDLDWDRVERVMRPKAAGAWHLHELTAADDLEHFVLYSSGATLIPRRGQANYAAANGYLDALAHHRRALGLPALSINWGPWADVGMGSGVDESVTDLLESMGTSLIRPTDGDAILASLMTSDAAQVAVLPMEWARMVEAGVPGLDRPLLRSVIDQATAESTAVETNDSFALELADLDEAGLNVVVRDRVRQTVAAVLGLDDDRQIDDHRTFTEAGMDSLMAVDLAGRLRRAAGVDVSATTTFDHPTVEALSQYVINGLVGSSPAEATTVRRAPGDEPIEASPAQSRLLFIEEFQPGLPFYNLPIALRLTGTLDVAALEAALTEVVRRHESLRTRFELVDGRYLQHVDAPGQPHDSHRRSALDSPPRT